MPLDTPSYLGKSATMTPPPRAGLMEAHPVGRLKDRIESMNRLGNMIAEDVHNIRMEIDRIAGPCAEDANKTCPEAPRQCDLDEFQYQLDRLDRLAQFTRQQLDRIRAI